jgi:hypothetical protein
MNNSGAEVERRAVQITLGVLSAIPVASGLAGIIAGPRTLPGGDHEVSATVDGEYRFVNAFWLAVAPLIWSRLPRVEEDDPTLPLVATTVFVGGLGRLLAWRRSGRPHTLFLPAIALEILGMPALIAWHRRLIRRSAPHS